MITQKCRNSFIFFDDIFYGNCIAKWIAEQFNIDTPAIDEVLSWAQEVRQEQIIENHRLVVDSPDMSAPFKTGIPVVYGFKGVTDCLD